MQLGYKEIIAKRVRNQARTSMVEQSTPKSPNTRHEISSNGNPRRETQHQWQVYLAAQVARSESTWAESEWWEGWNVSYKWAYCHESWTRTANSFTQSPLRQKRPHLHDRQLRHRNSAELPDFFKSAVWAQRNHSKQSRTQKVQISVPGNLKVIFKL